MRKMEKYKGVFVGKTTYQNKKKVVGLLTTNQVIKSQSFVVPWQMANIDKENILVK